MAAKVCYQASKKADVWNRWKAAGDRFNDSIAPALNVVQWIALANVCEVIKLLPNFHLPFVSRRPPAISSLDMHISSKALAAKPPSHQRLFYNIQGHLALSLTPVSWTNMQIRLLHCAPLYCFFLYCMIYLSEDVKHFKKNTSNSVWENATKSKPFILACVETQGDGIWTMLLL